MTDYRGVNIAILGGTGTLGRSVVDALGKMPHRPNKVLIYSRDEIKQLEMMEDYPSNQYPFLEYKLGDIRDLSRLEEVLEGSDLVIHAAAIKHVVMAENNPQECYKTNVIGTKNVVNACLAAGVKGACLISTDKAENPIGVYGESKLKAELIFRNANASEKAYFGVVRLGNIIGARGSVFEVFEKQRKTGVIKVTHPEATRFCISKEEAAQFVLNALMEKEAKILVPEMGVFSVIELAKKIAPECEIQITGLRKGDKLHEELGNISSSSILEETT